MDYICLNLNVQNLRNNIKEIMNCGNVMKNLYTLDYWRFIKRPLLFISAFAVLAGFLFLLMGVLFLSSLTEVSLFHLIIMLSIILIISPPVFIILTKKIFLSDITLFPNYFAMFPSFLRVNLEYNDIKSVDLCMFKDTLSSKEVLLWERIPLLNKNRLDNQIILVKIADNVSLPFFMFSEKKMGKIYIYTIEAEEFHDFLKVKISE